MPEIIDDFVAKISNVRDGFRLLFSSSPFPGFQATLVKGDEGHGGWWYLKDDKRDWLCAALFKYFRTAPPKIYVKAEAIE